MLMQLLLAVFPKEMVDSCANCDAETKTWVV